MSDEPVLIERSDDVATITLNRPATRNAMTEEITEAFSAAVEGVREDASVRAVIVTGAGQAFCAGGDYDFLRPPPGATVPEIRAKMRPFYGKYLAIRSLDVPTIAAINGAAIGAGFVLGLACDLRVAAEDARLSLSFTRIGLHPGMAATYLVTRLAGAARAAELLLTGRIFDGREAERFGLVNRAVPARDVMREARGLAEEIARAAPVAVRMVKRAVQLAERCDLETMLELEGFAQPVTMATSDLVEGLEAVKEKRTPRFRGV